MAYFQPGEEQIRHRLGIPDEAKKILIFSESSHWDPNWLFTADEYFERFVRRNLNQAIAALQQEARRIYSLECIFFLRQYWDHYPEKRDIIREFVNSGRLRLTSSGVSTADTLLPCTEAILRDLLIGQEWLRKNGMNQEPKLAYFTDSFGCTPALPSILNAAGFDRTAITRIDGMYFMGCDLELPRRFPRAGSSAEKLLRQERCLDFIWRDRNGAQVLCHWNAFTYGQGDMLAYVGLSRVYLARIAFPLRSDWHIARRIRQYVRQLEPYSCTPYMFCPIGFDFVEPIPDLVALLDRYNRNHYPHTGVWAVNAGLDDYLALIEAYQDQLPVLELDPNPYWTGFYASRPTLKWRCRKLVNNLLLAEKLAFLPENKGTEKAMNEELEDAWWQAATSNHHDFITGTSPDRVVEEEQIPRLEEGLDAVDRTIDRLAPALPASNVTSVGLRSLTWSQKNGRIQIDTAYYHIEMDEHAGGSIIMLLANDHTPLLTGISNDLVSYRDSGGLWRMGYEFAGGIWKETVRSSQHPCPMQVYEHENGLEVVSRVDLNGEPIQRRMWFDGTSPLLRCRIEGKAAEGYSVTVRFTTGIAAKVLAMDTPGGVIMRPLQRIYNPTFWPLHTFVHFQDHETGRGLAILQLFPGAVSYRRDGQLELVAMRNATREKVFGLIGIPGNPASGHERESYAYEYAILFTQQGNWQDNHVHLLARDVLDSPWSASRETRMHKIADTIITTNNPDVWVAAIKPASRGKGIIVRLNALAMSASEVLVSVPHLTVSKAFLCDARERDIKPLAMQNGAFRVPMSRTIATIRLE